MERHPSTSPQPHSDQELRQLLIDNEARRLLTHLDRQEAALLAIRSLLSDLAAENLALTDRRRLKQRLEASSSLTSKLALEREQIIRQIGANLPAPRPDLCLSELALLVSEPLRPQIRAARRRVSAVALQLSRQTATVRLIQGEERRINSIAYQLATGMVGSDRYDATGQKAVQPSSVHFDVRS